MQILQLQGTVTLTMKGMHRGALAALGTWAERRRRTPLVIRGARQVGKSYLARMLAERTGLELVEVVLEGHAELRGLFTNRRLEFVLQSLEARTGRRIVPGKSLLFLDEIQAVPEAFPFLRALHDGSPALHVVAAGSLLEFLLASHEFSMPVGRVEYLHLHPLRFEEFLVAAGHAPLAELLARFRIGDDVPRVLHDQAMDLLRQFLVIGGMPGPLSRFLEERSSLAAEPARHALLESLQDDFGRYGSRVDRELVGRVFRKVPELIGSRCRPAALNPDVRSREILRVIELLAKARLIHRVHHTAASSPPIGAGVDDRKFKLLFIDVGLLATLAGLDLSSLDLEEELTLANSGIVAEQFVGQELLATLPEYQAPALHYWAREARSASAEVDYVIATGRTVLPIEVRAGKAGSLRSVHRFLDEKGVHHAVRLNSEAPSMLSTRVELPEGREVRVELLSLPLYMAGQVRRLARELVARKGRSGRAG